MEVCLLKSSRLVGQHMPLLVTKHSSGHQRRPLSGLERRLRDSYRVELFLTENYATNLLYKLGLMVRLP